MGKQIDYKAMLSDLENERKALVSRLRAIEIAITALRPFASEGTDENFSNTTVKVIGSPIFPSNAFKDMPVIEATKKYLTMVGAPQPAGDIAAALEKGGLVHQSKDFRGTVYQLLRRRAKDHGDIVNHDGEWGLVEWNGKKPA